MLGSIEIAKWYVKRNSKQAGPFETAQLKQFAAEGKIKPDDLVRREDQTAWSKASDVKGLFVPSSVQSIELPAPTLAQDSIPSTPPPVPIQTTSLSITDPKITLSKVLMCTIAGSLVAISFCTRMVPFDEEGMPIISLGFVLFGLLSPVYIIADTAMLFMSWSALPSEKRPFKLHPAAIVIMTFIPIVGYIAYFVAYGMLGAAWWSEGAKAGAILNDNKPLQSLRWMGFLLAGWLVFMWLMHWLSEIAFFAEFDMSWWDTPLAEGERRADVLERLLSPAGLLTLFLAAWYWSFYYSQIFIRTTLQEMQDGKSAITS